MEEEKSGINCAGLEKVFSKLKIEDAPAREPYNLRPRNKKKANQNGTGYVSKQHKKAHKVKKCIKEQEEDRKSKSRVPTLSLLKIKIEWDIESIVEETTVKCLQKPSEKKENNDSTDSIQIKTEPPYFDCLPESQQSWVEFHPDIKPLPIHLQPIPLNTNNTQPIYPKDAILKQSRIHGKDCKIGPFNQSSTPKPQEKLFMAPCLTEKRVKSGEDIFSLIETCRIVDKTGCRFLMVKYSWSDRHLTLIPGLNILATCKNFECTKHLEGVVCPRGLFEERRGYCPLDGELYSAVCPSCKTRIPPDDSLGFGFYNCDFQLTYKLHNHSKYTAELENRDRVLYFGKCKPLNETFDILQVKMSA